MSPASAKALTPMWFKIKCNHDNSHSPLHVFEMIPRCQKLPSKVRDIVIPVVERNAYGVHHESISTAMVSSTNENHKELVCKRILHSREDKVPSRRIRNLRVPKLNVKASSYIDLIDWTDTVVSEPAFTASITAAKIQEMISRKTLMILKFLSYLVTRKV